MTSTRTALRANTLQDEVGLVTKMLKDYPLSQQQIGWIEAEGTRLVRDCRARGDDKSVLDAFLQQFGLSNSEGVALMCLKRYWRATGTITCGPQTRCSSMPLHGL